MVLETELISSELSLLVNYSLLNDFTEGFKEMAPNLSVEICA